MDVKLAVAFNKMRCYIKYNDGNISCFLQMTRNIFKKAIHGSKSIGVIKEEGYENDKQT